MASWVANTTCKHFTTRLLAKSSFTSSFLARWGSKSSKETPVTPNANASTIQYPEGKPRVFSGIQPTGVPHIGNYVGAIKNWLRLQERYSGNMLLSVVDLHSITLPTVREQLHQNILDMTACLLACGIEPEKIILFQQSMVPQHSELAWILACLCTVPRLQRLPQWKEKKTKVQDPSVGLLTYPILQAADILLYKATMVPVGTDQVYHIDMTENLGRSFNRVHGPVFPHLRMLAGEFPKIRSLRDPNSKMSKSDISSKGTIGLLDTPEQILEKCKKAVTDFTSEVTYDPETRPGVSNLMEIHMALTDLSAEEVTEESFLLAEDTGLYKLRLAKIITEKLTPIRIRALAYQRDPSFLKDVLRDGAVKASKIAEQTMDEVHSIVGFK